MNYKIIGMSLILTAMSVGYSSAHDFWTQPSEFVVRAGQPVNVRLFVGHGDEIKQLPRMPNHLRRFEIHGPDGVEPVPGRTFGRPAGQMRLTRPGIYTLVYLSKHTYVELGAEKFHGYLREEGLADIIAERKRRGESDEPGKESFARYTKALVQVDGATEGYDRKIGLPVELTALDNPFTRRQGDTIRFVLERLGKPMPGMIVELISLGDLDKKYRAKTDKDGQVSFAVPDPGSWMVATTWMRRAPANVKGDWESYWATTSFAVSSK